MRERCAIAITAASQIQKQIGTDQPSRNLVLLKPGVASAGIAESACILVALVVTPATRSGGWRYSDYTFGCGGFYLNNALGAESHSISLVQAGSAKTARLSHTDNGGTFADYA
jgi:hypothetical protein